MTSAVAGRKNTFVKASSNGHASVNALLDTVESRTHSQVQNLEIDRSDESVVVTGSCNSYYVKQLVTHAVLAACPLVKLDNRVQVCVA